MSKNRGAPRFLYVTNKIMIDFEMFRFPIPAPATGLDSSFQLLLYALFESITTQHPSLIRCLSESLPGCFPQCDV